MMRYQERRSLALLPIAVGVLLILTALLATAALADSGGMPGMQGMTDEEMQGMHEMMPEGMHDEMERMHEEMQGMHEQMPGMQTPGTEGAAGGAGSATPAASGHASGHGADGAADSHDGMQGASGDASVNWYVIGGFVVLVLGSTLAAMATKRHLRRRMLSGELASAGVRDV